MAKVSITGYSGITIVAGNSGTPKLTYTGTAKAKSFKSSNTGVATINSSTGAVKGVKAGTATMTVTLTNYDGTTATKTCTVTVQTAVAQVGSTYYASVTNAVNAISSSGTITMLTNSNENVDIPSGKTITLNLNSKTITGDFDNEGTFSVSNGIITCESGWTIANYSTMYANQVTIKHTAYDNGATVMNCGSFVMNGGTIYSASNAFVSRGGTYEIRNATITGETAHGVISENGSNGKFYNCSINNLINNDTVGNGQVWLIGSSAGILQSQPVISIGISGDEIGMYIYSGSQYTNAEFPTWSNNNGQDDIIWYSSVDNGLYDSSFASTDHRLSSHPNYANGLSIHVYLNSRSIFYGGITLYEW